ncbi:Os07g0448300, partial [Oryza sativa Japonica Group]
AGAEDDLVVQRRDRRPDERPDPEDPLRVPCLAVVVHDGGAEAPRRVDAGAGDRDRRQVHHEHREPDRQRRQHLDFYHRIAGVALGVGGGEDGVHQHERADDLRGEAGARGVAGGELVGAAAVPRVEAALEPLDERDAADGAEALRRHVQEGAHQGHLPGQEEAERHRRVDVPAGDAGGAVDEDEDHAAERPRDAEDAHAASAPFAAASVWCLYPITVATVT